MIREHAGAALVAAAIVAAALVEGFFDPTAYAAASILIWAAVIAGLVGRAVPASRIAGTAAAAGICLGALALLAGLSIGWAGDQGRAFYEAVRASSYLGLFTLAACTASRGGRRQWLTGLTVGISVVALLALLSHLQPGLLGDGELETRIPGAADRLYYPIGYWNGLAALLAVGTVLLARAGVHAPARGLRSAAIGILPMVLVTIWLTDSTGGRAATLLGLAALVAVSPDRARLLPTIAIGAVAGTGLIAASEGVDGDGLTAIVMAVAVATAGTAWLLDGRQARVRPSRRAAIGLAAIGVLAVAVAVAATDPAERFREFKRPPPGTTSGATSASDLSSSGRWQFWGEALDAFESAPAAGIGAGAFEDWWAQNATIGLFVRNPHSLPLQQASELGVLGLLLLAGFAGAVGLAAVRRLSAGREGDGGLLTAVLAAAALSAAIDWTWAIPAVAAPAVIAAALLTASAPGRALSRDGYWLGLGAVAIAWVAIVAAGLVVLSELKLDQSRDAAAEGRLDEAVERAQEARTVVPFSGEPYLQLALIEELRGNLDEAVERLAQAQRRDAEDWRLALIEVRLQKGRGDEVAADRAFNRANDLNSLTEASNEGQSGSG